MSSIEDLKMNKVKVKTLSNEDQLFDFEDSMTVLNLKEKISERLNITPDNQRLIYCGRILQNDKKLEEYDLNNKVIHLVDSPPNLNANNENRSRNQQSNATNQSTNGSSTDPEVTASTSNFSININLNGANVHSNAQSRVFTLTRILDYINRAIDKLEDPNQSPTHEQSFEATSNDNVAAGSRAGFGDDSVAGSGSHITEIGILALSDQPDERNAQNFLDQMNADIQESLFSSNGSNSMVIDLTNLGGGTTTSTNSTTSSTNNQTTPNASTNATSTNQQSTQNNNNNVMGIIRNLTRNLINHSIDQSMNFLPFATAHSNSSASANQRNRSASSSTTTTSNNATANNTTTNANNNTSSTNRQSQSQDVNQPNRSRRVTWAEYAELLNSVRQTQERFNPHFNSFQQSLLQRHGTLSHAQAEEQQTKYRLIARCMHHLAHVYHLLSDFFVNYVHQQDQTIQVFESLNLAPTTRRTPMNEMRMGNGTIIVGTGSLNNLANLNTQRSTSSSRNEQQPTVTNNSTISSDPSSLPRDFVYPNRRTESPNLNTAANVGNSSNRSNLPPFLSSHFSTSSTNQSSTANNQRNNPDARERINEHNLLQSLFGSSLPNLQNSNVIISGSSPRTAPINVPGTTSISIIQTVGLGPGRNRSNNNNLDASRPPTTAQQQPQQQQTSQQNLGASFLQSLFGNSTTSATNTRPTSQQQESTTTTTSNSQTNNSSNQPTGQYPSFLSNQRFRMPTQTGGFANNYFYNHAHNFDPHLPCNSNWLIPEVRSTLSVEMNMTGDASLADLISLGRQGASSNQHNTTSNTNSSSSATNSRRRVVSGSTRQASSLQAGTSANLDVIELFNEIRKLFSSYLERDELLRRIDNLPRSANNSLSSFINSMNILNLVSKNKSNITLELFMILAQKISVTEFLKIIFMQDFKCLNRAQDSMVNYARTNLLFSTEEPFDTSSCVDDLLKIWKQILLSSFNELEFSERTFSALISELRANLSVFLRVFTRSFDNNTDSSFASTIYLAIERLCLDFHTSLSQMFRSPNNVMRAYKNILIQIFPDHNVRNIIMAILSYRVPAIDETERVALESTRFKERLMKLSDQTTASSSANSNNSQALLDDNRQATPSSSSNSASSSSDYQTPMEIDIDLDSEPAYGTERWMFCVPKNWIKTLKNDKEKVLRQSRIGKPFSSLYKEAYKKNH